MVSVDKAVIAKIVKGGISFEILVDPDKALEYKKGKVSQIDDVLAVANIFKDSGKGDRASDEELTNVFGTADRRKIAEAILKHGDIQLTTEQKRKMVEIKKTQIANMISKQAINPQTRLPHPPQRIINAMAEAHAIIDPFKDVDEQMETVLQKIREIIPISIERLEIRVTIPIQYSGKASSVLRTMAPIKKEDWSSSSWSAVIEIPAGMQSEIYDKLNSLTSGHVEVTVLGK